MAITKSVKNLAANKDAPAVKLKCLMSTMNISHEEELYPYVIEWLRKFLKGRHRNSDVDVYDTHKINLSKFLQNNELQNYFPEFSAFDIKVDITGIIKSKKSVKLAFVECKTDPITLKDVGQILGYSKVANPDYSFIISPSGLSSPLSVLLQTFGRYDLLEYGSRKIRIAKWNLERMEIDSNTILPPGEHFLNY